MYYKLKENLQLNQYFFLPIFFLYAVRRPLIDISLCYLKNIC
jgi:hypothetical protein